MTDYVFETSSGEEIPVVIETRRGLRNMTLRPKILPMREVRVSKPWLISTSSAVKFIEQKRRWLEKIFDDAPEKIILTDGDIIEFLGKKVIIRHDSYKKSNFYSKDEKTGEDILIIGGAPEMLTRRVRDFIKSEFLSEVKKIIKTAPMDFHPKKIAIRDTTSRWGSCSSNGTISFSWRLAFAPVDIMRYVIMHELAHLKYMDHSVHFWATVSHLYGDGVGRAKLWLTKNGQNLHKYF
ncbi:MAG TPA: SprT family zinc-dependent metalloprotease [Alphaproteobacteria bacterium]|nr:SprT family zinc-dependent metalloprotease [Alphaproteobacteria bacterium]